MANFVNNWTKTALTTITDSYLFLVSLTTGETKPISWANLKALLLTYFQGTAMVFSQKIKAPNGTATTEVVNYQQLATKIDKAGGTFSGTVTFDQIGTNRPDFTGTLPASNSDPMGNVGDEFPHGKRLYRKTSSDGWCYIEFTRL